MATNETQYKNEVADLIREQESRNLPIWTRLPGEPTNAYTKFCIYRDLGHGRTLVGAAQARGNEAPGGGLRQMAARWSWVLRAAAFDDYQIAEEERLRKSLPTEAEWRERAKQGRAEAFETSQDIGSIVRDRIDLHFGRKRNDDGTFSEVEAEPLSIGARELPGILRLAVSLRDSAINGPVKRGRPAKGQPLDDDDAQFLNLKEMTTEQLKRVQASSKARPASKTRQ